jgi:metallo-beta-lactamase family protein
VERTQELIADLIDLMERGEVPTAPIFLDSPLAIRATEVFRQHAPSLDPDIDLDRLLRSPHLRFTETVDESKSIAKLTGFHIIIAASGMCDAGRIRHHLKRWLWNSGGTVLLVGFQAQGTLGRFLENGAKAVRIQGEEIKVAARIRRIDEYSGHADGRELARWIAARRHVSRGVFLVHGEEPALSGLSDRISERTIPAAKVFRPFWTTFSSFQNRHPPRSTWHTAGGWRRRRSLHSIGTMICRSLSSISTTELRGPPMIAREASSSGACGAHSRRSAEHVH